MFGHSAISNEVKIMVLLLTTENLYFLEWRCHDTSSFTYLWGFLPRHSSINSKGKIHSKFLSNLLLLRNQTERFFSNILPQRLFNSNRNKLSECLCLSEDNVKHSPDVQKHPVVKKGFRHTLTRWLQEEPRQWLEPFRIEEWNRTNPRQMPDPFSSVSKSTSFLLESEETWDTTSCFLVMGGTRAWPAMTWKIAGWILWV